MQLNTCTHELLRPPYKPNWQPCVLVWEVAIFLWALALVVPRQERRRACCSGTSAGFSKLARQLGGIKATLSANKDASVVVYVVRGVHSCFAHQRRLSGSDQRHRRLLPCQMDGLLHTQSEVVVPNEYLFSPFHIRRLDRCNWNALAILDELPQSVLIVELHVHNLHWKQVAPFALKKVGSCPSCLRTSEAYTWVILGVGSLLPLLSLTMSGSPFTSSNLCMLLCTAISLLVI